MFSKRAEILVSKLGAEPRPWPRAEKLILSILVDTFISKISLPMQPVPEIGSISVA